MNASKFYLMFSFIFLVAYAFDITKPLRPQRFFFTVFIMLVLVFRFLIPFELVFVHGVKEGIHLFLVYSYQYYGPVVEYNKQFLPL